MNRAATLEAFARALRREAHNLAQRPDLTWQQLHNRLQWEAHLSVAGEFARRSAPGAPAWLRTKTPHPESNALVLTLAGHRGAVTGCAVGPDSSFIASASRDGSVRLWDARSGTELRALTGHSAPVNDCEVSPDGAFVVSASDDETLRVWDPESGDQLGVLEGHEGPVEACAVSPDATFVVSAGDDGTLRLWDPEGCEQLRVIRCRTGGVYDCAVSPDATFVVSAGNFHTAKLWGPTSGDELGSLSGHDGWMVMGCAVSPDAGFVVTASDDGTLKLWGRQRGEERATLEGHTGWALGAKGAGNHVRDCAVAPDQSFVVSASEDTTVRLWEVGSGAELRSLRGHGGAVRRCAVSSDGTFVVSAGEDRTLRLWDPAVAEDPAAIPSGHAGWIMDCAFSPDGAFVVTASDDGTLKLWGGASGTERATLRGHTRGVWGCAVSADGSCVVSTGGDGTVRLWDPDSAEGVGVLKGRGKGILGRRDCAMSADGSFVVASDGSETVRVWDAASGERVRSLGGGRHCAITPDGRHVVLGTRLRDPASGREIRAGEGDEPTAEPADFAISPDGAFVVSGRADGRLELRDLQGAQPPRTFGGGTGRISAVAISPDAALALSAGSDGVLRAWDLADGSERATLPLPGALLCVAAHPYLPTAACGGEGRSLFLIDLVGIEYGPLAVSAVDRGAGPLVRCPGCWHAHRLDRSWLGRVIACPTSACTLDLRVNPFVVTGRRLQPAPRWAFWRR